MIKCEECINFKSTYSDSGYCNMWDMYVKTHQGCEDGEPREDKVDFQGEGIQKGGKNTIRFI